MLTESVDLVLCGHSLGAGVAAMLGMARATSAHFRRVDLRCAYVDVGRPKDLSNSEVQWTSSRQERAGLCVCASVRLLRVHAVHFSSNLFNSSLTDAALSRLTSHLVVSLVYSHDVVSRLSLGSVRDLRNAAMWLCEAESSSGEGSAEGWSAVTSRARSWKDGTGGVDDLDWVSLGTVSPSLIFLCLLKRCLLMTLSSASVHRDA